MGELAGLTAWMPGNAHDSEWAEYYWFLSTEFGVQIDTSGPIFGRDDLTERIRSSRDLIMFGSKMQFPVNPDFTEVSPLLTPRRCTPGPYVARGEPPPVCRCSSPT